VKRFLIFAWSGLLVSALLSEMVWAQATAQINGTVRDQSGAVLPGVEVTATQTETGVSRNTITNETGSYVLANLAVGPYRLEAALPGFRSYVQSGIVLQVNASPAINVVLEVGQVAETIEVQANAALVETRSVGVGQVVENARILELPLNGRNVNELIALAGGATPSVAVGGGRDPFAKIGVSVSGGLSTSLNYNLDGANHNNPFANTYLSMPFPDALQEFKVETSATSAQNGMHAAGAVSAVTKSGTNELHGDLFEFVRNGMFNARNAFATSRDTLKRNQFGGTLGGPIIANKLFFFGGYQGTRIRQDPPDRISFVPTAAMLTGDFTVFASPACNAGRQITLRAPFVNNQVDPALFSKPAVALAAKMPATADPCGRIVYSNPNIENDYMAVGKIDYQRNPTHSLFGRYLADHAYNPPAYTLNKNPLSVGVGADALAQAFTFGDTYLFSSNVVNSFRLSANRMSGGKTGVHFFGFPDLGVKMFTYEPQKLIVSITGGFSIASRAGPTKMAIFAGGDDLSVVRGNHQLAFGVQGAGWWVNSYSDNYSAGNTAFNGQTTGLGMADFFLGNVSDFVMGTLATQNKRAKYFGMYAADAWKVNAKLTLSYGLRWEPYFPLINIDGSAIHYDHDGLAKGIRTSRFTNAPPGLYFNGDPGFPGLAGMYNKWWNFSPRVGLAWDVNGDGRTSLRASAGTFYDYPSTDYQQGLSIAPPWNPRIATTNVRFEDPWRNYPGGDPFPMAFGRNVARDVPFPLFGIVTAMDYDTPNMQVIQWNLSIQRQVGNDWLVSASYLGNSTAHLWTTKQINPAVFLGTGPCTLNGVQYTTCSTTGNTDQRRRLILENPKDGQFFGYVNKIDAGGTASYNGLLLAVQRRVAHGVTVNANHTWSHCISDPWQEAANSGSGNSGYTNPDNRRFDRGNCIGAATDRRHVFNLSAVAETPQFSNATWRAVGSGWRFSPIFKILSGGYLSVTTSTDVGLSGIGGQRVNQILADPYGDKSVKNYLNPKAFAQPAPGTLGNSGAGAIRGPGTWQFDAALSRTFQVREAQKLEFRAEAFNVTNAFRMTNPTTVLNSNTFGQVTAALDPRIMQFALKFVF
jgi:Carboxypeptidase regulatory-like domain/TonB dependent receptor